MNGLLGMNSMLCSALVFNRIPIEFLCETTAVLCCAICITVSSHTHSFIDKYELLLFISIARGDTSYKNTHTHTQRETEEERDRMYNLYKTAAICGRTRRKKNEKQKLIYEFVFSTNNNKIPLLHKNINTNTHICFHI